MYFQAYLKYSTSSPSALEAIALLQAIAILDIEIIEALAFRAETHMISMCILSDDPFSCVR